MESRPDYARTDSMAVLKHNNTLDTWIYSSLALMEAGID